VVFTVTSHLLARTYWKSSWSVVVAAVVVVVLALRQAAEAVAVAAR
jgi:hypothetical protein